MVDIETTGLMPDRGAILQISAVRFNLDTRELDPEVFNMSLTIPAHRFWQESTREWWISQKASTYESVVQNAQDWRLVMKKFLDWVSEKSMNPRFWAKPTHFDYMFISSYFADAGYVNPFKYFEAKDLNSYLAGLHYPNPVPKLDIPFDGSAHNALDDAFHQIAILFNHLEHKDAKVATQG